MIITFVDMKRMENLRKVDSNRFEQFFVLYSRKELQTSKFVTFDPQMNGIQLFI